MRYEMVNGDTRIINIMVSDGWTLHSVIPNPYPQPYFYALMAFDKNEFYNVENVEDHVYRRAELNPRKKQP